MNLCFGFSAEGCVISWIKLLHWSSRIESVFYRYNDCTKNMRINPPFSLIIAPTEGETWMNVPGCRGNLLKSPAVCALIFIGQRSSYHGDTVATARALRPFYHIWSVLAPFVASDWWTLFFRHHLRSHDRNLSLFFPSAQIKGT